MQTARPLEEAQDLIGGALAPVDLVASWPLVKVRANIATELHLTCAGTVLDADLPDGGKHGGGQSLWWASLPGNTVVGIAFQWCQVVPGVVAIADPMAVVTNMLLQDEGGYLSESGHAQVLLTLLARHHSAAQVAAVASAGKH